MGRRESSHRPALDGVRFVAFLGVFCHHAFWAHPRSQQLPFVRFGHHGVEVFFVLSGFLIGGILLDSKERDRRPIRARLGAFYARRALRIFPAYYALLLLLPLANETLRLGFQYESWPWHLAYLTNVKLYLEGAAIGLGSHFWSLSVEEHFYLIAPAVILVAPRRALGWGCVALWVLVASARALIHYRGVTTWYWPLSPMHFDTLAVGLGAAIVEREGAFLGVPRARVVRSGAACGLAYVVLVVWFCAGGSDPTGLSAVLQKWLIAAAAASLVLVAWRGDHPLLTAGLASRPIAYLGRISYGLYLVHPFVLFAVHAKHSVVGVTFGFAVCVILASASWFLMERPILRYKEKLAG